MGIVTGWIHMYSLSICLLYFFYRKVSKFWSAQNGKLFQLWNWRYSTAFNFKFQFSSKNKTRSQYTNRHQHLHRAKILSFMLRQLMDDFKVENTETESVQYRIPISDLISNLQSNLNDFACSAQLVMDIKMCFKKYYSVILRKYRSVTFNYNSSEYLRKASN